MLNFRPIKDKTMTQYSDLGVMSKLEKSWQDFERLGGTITPVLDRMRKAGFGAPKAESRIPQTKEVPEKKVFGDVIKSTMMPNAMEYPGPLDVLKSVGQSIARSFLAVGVEAKEQLLVPEEKRADFGIASYTPQTEIEKKIFGTDQAVNFRTVGEEVLAIGGEDFKQKWGKSAIPLGIVIAGLDVTPIGYGKKDAAEMAFKTISKTDDVVKISKELKTVVKGSDEEIEFLAKSLKAVNKEEDVAKIVNEAGKAKTTSKELKPLEEEAKTLRGTKGMTADDIMKKYPNIKLKRDVPAKDIYGNKIEIEKGEKLTPYELKGNKILLQDGETYIVSKNQFQNIKGQSTVAESKPFAPELEGLEESVKKADNWLTEKDIKSVKYEESGLDEPRWVVEFKTGQRYIAMSSDSKATAIKNATNKALRVKGESTRYSGYQLPGGKDYKEILIKAPIKKKFNPDLVNIKRNRQSTTQGSIDIEYNGKKIATYDDSGDVSKNYKKYTDEEAINTARKLYEKGDRINEIEPTSGAFKSSHWDEPNVISHLRLNDRTYKGKKVTFMEEIQSDWAREGRDKGFVGDKGRQVFDDYVDILRKKYNTDARIISQNLLTQGEKTKYQELFDGIQDFGEGVPSHPLVQGNKWQEPTIKRGLKEAVENDSKYFAWITGEQTSARYNLATHLDDVKWNDGKTGVKKIELRPKTGSEDIVLAIDKKGEVLTSSHNQMIGKRLDEVLGKGLADKIMAKETGTLSGEGLKFGGEWADNLYNKQVKNIVEKLTGQKVEMLDMGLPIKEANELGWRILGKGEQGTALVLDNKKAFSKLKVGEEISRNDASSWIVTDIIGNGKFKAVPKRPIGFAMEDFSKVKVGSKDWNDVIKMFEETFDISQKTTKQMGIKITPEVKNKIKGIAPEIKTSEKQFETKRGVIKIHEDDLAEMADFTDYASGELKLSSKEAHQIELNASRIADKYGIKQPKTIKGLSNEFGRELEKQGFKREIPKSLKDKPTISEPTKQLEVSQKLGDIKQPTTTSSTQKRAIKEELQLGDQVIKGQSPIQSKSLSKDYHIFGENKSIIKETEKLLSPTIAGKERAKIGLAKRFSGVLSNYWTRINEVMQDDWYRVRKMVNEKGIKVANESDPYLKRELYFGRIGYKTEQVESIVKEIDKDILTTSKKLKINDKQLADEVNKYLYYIHTPERNLHLGKGAAGITTEKATEGLKKLESLEYYDEIVRISKELKELNGKTLDTLLDGQVITKELHSLLREKYKEHVPLQRIFNETENVSDILVSSGLDVRGTGIKRAVGSKREVSDIFNNIVANYKQALIRTEKNRVDLATLKFARENKYFNGLFEEIKQREIGRTFKGQPILKEVRDPQVLSLMENGKQVYLKINDPKLAIALKGVNRQKMDGVMRVIASFTRLYSGLMTRFNPEFAFPNKIRDLQEMAVYMASKKEIGFKGALKTTIRDPQSAKDVFDYLRGAKTEGAILYKELKSLGGTTGGLGLSTRKQLDLDIEAIRKMNRNNPKKATRKIVGYIDSWNTLFEDSTRLSVYKQGLKNGLSKERAAFLAKESTINFNRMGTAGPVVNGIYMFSNASIQGSVKLLRAMKDPKVAAVTIGSVTGAVFATQEWNDSIDKNWRDKVSEWDRMNGLTVVLPSTSEKFNYITIPVSWGLKPINTMSNYTVDLMNDKKTNIQDAMSGIFSSIVDAYNPVGGTDFYSAITPTILDLPLDITRNKKWSGNTIRPDWDKYAPMSEQYFDSLKNTTLGKITINISETISEKSGGRIEMSPADMAYATQQLIGGTGRFMSKGINTISDILKGEIQVKEIPFVSRFLRSKNIEETGYGVGATKEIKDILTEQSRKRIKDRREAEAIYEQFKKMPTEQAQEAFNELVNQDEDMAKKISEIGEEEKLGLNYTQRLIKQLGVENGERAKYIYSQLNKLEDKKSKSEYWTELVDKKIISKKVNDQILWLISNKSEE